MKVIINDKFYEFQNPNTDEIFNKQKDYLSKLILECGNGEKSEELLTNLYSLFNLSESLIHEFVSSYGMDKTLETLKAKEVK
ncbi:hypothetical protein [Helicovermis profundi]|uniref:Phage protein n=1 Tax=Helicovermis profundi TaxID=3065157 RepID=A0AAU9ERQ0_9FIRM|nr:hypothetical protein HLPR_14710 [Clostridia bacterium S502]